MTRKSFAFVLVLFFLAPLCHDAAAQPRVFSCDADALVRARDGYRTGTPQLKPAFDRLRNDADTALNVPLYSVMDKQQIPAGGNKHDYMSLARYYWPDTTKANGLPYASRDGQVNPEILTITDAT